LDPKKDQFTGEETVQQSITRIGDITYNYNLKKTNAEISGGLWEATEKHEEALADFMALFAATRRWCYNWITSKLQEMISRIWPFSFSSPDFTLT